MILPGQLCSRVYIEATKNIYLIDYLDDICFFVLTESFINYSALFKRSYKFLIICPPSTLAVTLMVKTLHTDIQPNEYGRPSRLMTNSIDSITSSNSCGSMARKLQC